MRRFIIMIVVLVATILVFNQEAMAQKRVKIPIFEGIVTAKKGTVNIRKEASVQSEKIGTIQADKTFYPILDQTENWYRILVSDIDIKLDLSETRQIDGNITCGYVSKAFSKIAVVEDSPRSLSQMINYLEDKLECSNITMPKGKYKQQIIASGSFIDHYENDRFGAGEKGRFFGEAVHKGVMVGSFVNFFTTSIPDNMDYEDSWNPGEFDVKELTEQQLDNAKSCALPAILIIVPESYTTYKGNKGMTVDNKGVEVMYVDMDKYPFKTETIQFNDDKSFSYFIVNEDEK